ALVGHRTQAQRGQAVLRIAVARPAVGAGALEAADVVAGHAGVPRALLPAGHQLRPPGLDRAFGQRADHAADADRTIRLRREHLVLVHGRGAQREVELADRGRREDVAGPEVDAGGDHAAVVAGAHVDVQDVARSRARDAVAVILDALLVATVEDQLRADAADLVLQLDVVVVDVDAQARRERRAVDQTHGLGHRSFRIQVRVAAGGAGQLRVELRVGL